MIVNKNSTFVVGTHAARALLRFTPKRARVLWLLQGLKHKDEWVGLAKKAHIPIKEGDRNALSRLAQDDDHQGIVLECKPFEYASLDDLTQKNPTCLIALDEIENPGNLGRAARAARMFGAEGLIITKHRSAQVTKIAEKAAVGAFSHIPVAQVTNLSQALQELADLDYQILGTDHRANTPLWACDFKKPTVWVVGNEETGLRRLTKERCTQLVSIPMAHSESLNAADALSICLYEHYKARLAK